MLGTKNGRLNIQIHCLWPIGIKKSIMMWDGRQVWGHLEVLICLTLKPDGARGIFGYAGNSQSIIKMLSRKSYI